MAENIRIPSPSVLLNSSTSPSLEPGSAKSPSAPTPKSAKKRPSTGNAKNTAAPVGTAKPKQTKSRNGCATCKKKRLKCDEGKPQCKQCLKRKVPCGGYTKDFKWRPFDEPQLAQKTATTHEKKVSFSAISPQLAAEPTSRESSGSNHSRNLNLIGVETLRIESGQADEISDYKTSEQQCFPEEPLDVPLTRNSPQESFTAPFFGSYDPIGYREDLELSFEDVLPGSAETAPSSISSNEDLPVSGRAALHDLGSRSQLTSPSVPNIFPQGNPSNSNFKAFPNNEEGEPSRDQCLDGKADEQQSTSLINLATPVTLVGANISTQRAAINSLDMMLHQPQVHVGCPDVLFSRFDRETCGILSVKDGPTENGWRTLVLPMARTCPPLFHALAALTSFHLVKQLPSLREQGIEHMQASLKGLRSDLPNMRADAAIATSLVLAFAESWDKKITTGIDHIKGANCMLRRALSRHKEKALSGRDLHRLRFLCSTWVYMDVIARLTSTNNTDHSEFDEIYRTFASWSFPQRAFPLRSPSTPIHPDSGVDTLMGCAASLFPIIGHTANLVRRVYRTTVNNAPIIATAAELKKQLESWVPLPSSVYAAPEDPQTSVDDCLRTAEAYRGATLLHLFQAVPEIANGSSEQLAHQTLNLLARVPLASRAVIVQIYPLLVAGCEMVDQEMRDWVKERWLSMGKKMGIGVIEASEKVVEEVWRRRDEYELQVASSINDGSLYLPEGDDEISRFFNAGLDLDEAVSMSSAMMLPPKRTMVGNMDFAYTVKGNLHWLGVMKDWEWEVLLG